MKRVDGGARAKTQKDRLTGNVTEFSYGANNRSANVDHKERLRSAVV